MSVNLRSQPWNATVSIHKIAQLLLNIVTFSHGAALQTNHRASFNHVSHGEPRWLCFGCAMQIISVVLDILSEIYISSLTSISIRSFILARLRDGCFSNSWWCPKAARWNLWVSTCKDKWEYFRGNAIVEATVSEFFCRREMRLVKSGIENIVVRKCEFSKLQFPKSQLERSALNVPVR